MEYESGRKTGKCASESSIFEQRHNYQRKLWLDLSLVEKFDPKINSGTPKAPRPNCYQQFTETDKGIPSPE